MLDEIFKIGAKYDRQREGGTRRLVVDRDGRLWSAAWEHHSPSADPWRIAVYRYDLTGALEGLQALLEAES